MAANDPWELTPEQSKMLVSAKKDPWEYSPSDAASIAAQKGLAQHAAPAPRPQIIQEMPKDVSTFDRFNVANFSNDPQAAAQYLREKYPNYEIGIVDNQIGMKPKGDTGPLKALSPNFGVNTILHPTELLQKAADYAYPIGSGVASTAVGGLAAGAAAPSGPGALAAGAAAAGATSAGAEALRQQIGKSLGINQEINGTPIALEGGLGAAAPLAFGIGGAKGAVGAGYDALAQNVLPKVGQVISGVPAKSILTASQRMPEIKQLEQQGVLDFAEKAHENIADNLAQAKQKIGQNIQSSIENAGGTVDLTEAKKPFEDLLGKLRDQYKTLKTPEVKSKIKDVEDQLKFYFSKENDVPNVKTFADEFGNTVAQAPESIGIVTPTQAFSLKQSMADLGGLDKVRDTGLKSSLNGMSPAQKEIAIAARQSKSALDQGISKAVDTAEQNTGGMQNLREQYRDLNNLTDYVEPYFKTPEKTYNTMRNTGNSKSKEILLQTVGDMDKKYGTDALNNAQLLDAYNYFGNPSFSPLSTGGSTSTGRAIPLAAAGGTVGYWIGNKFHAGYPGMVAGATLGSTLGSPSALRQYMNVGQGIRSAADFLGPANTAIPLSVGNATIQNNQYKQSPWNLFPQQQPQGVQP